ncbi:hypothetical protein C3747_183g50 [Trypanosoma cruzi]|uniref:DUF7920 domain-containing protein n=1 Tax=Trypanosoma cruzi TaxID=5693 RepID=A0A2V2W2T8_TRYCR|nr:hypothetical protein C3747_183g50 [Trypanosoma cruzi]
MRFDVQRRILPFTVWMRASRGALRFPNVWWASGETRCVRCRREGPLLCMTIWALRGAPHALMVFCGNVDASPTTGPRETLKFYAVTCRGATPHEGLCADPASSMAALQSFGLDVVTPQPAVELGTDEYAVLRDGVARRLNCEGAVLYGCNEAGVVCGCGSGRSHAYAMERAAQEAIVTHRLCGWRSARGSQASSPGCQRRCAGASVTGKRNASTILCSLQRGCM